MFFERNMPSGQMARIVVPQFTIDRLYTTCFRGHELRCAGNFHRWRTVDSLLKDDGILTRLLEEIEDVATEPSADSESVTIEHTAFVGWESTISRDSCLEADLEEFSPNQYATAMRVIPSRTQYLAPQTKDVTVIFKFHLECGIPTIVIKSIYPGTDIGEIDGNVTDREGRVFLDWSQPGE
jgi:hypothetical protein